MAEIQDPRALIEAEEGGREFSTRIEELEAGAEIEANSIVRFLRGIPADDKAKKRELAKFFQGAGGGKYSRAERKAYYDDLLGVERNRRTIG